MAIITGYARQPEKKWPKIILVSMLLLTAFLLLVLFYPAREPAPKKSRAAKAPATEVKTEVKVIEKPKPVAAGSEIRVEKIVFTSQIGENNLPLDNLSGISADENGKVYCYTRVVSAAVPRTIHHVWIAPGGEVMADIKLNIHSQPADTWSYVNLAGMETGAWELQVQNDDGTVLARGSFTKNAGR